MFTSDGSNIPTEKFLFVLYFICIMRKKSLVLHSFRCKHLIYRMLNSELFYVFNVEDLEVCTVWRRKS